MLPVFRIHSRLFISLLPFFYTNPGKTEHKPNILPLKGNISPSYFHQGVGGYRTPEVAVEMPNR